MEFKILHIWVMLKSLRSKLRKKDRKNQSSPVCDLQKLGANLYSKLHVAPFSCKKWGIGWKEGWMEGWKDGKAGLRIAYINQK